MSFDFVPELIGGISDAQQLAKVFEKDMTTTNTKKLELKTVRNGGTHTENMLETPGGTTASSNTIATLDTTVQVGEAIRDFSANQSDSDRTIRHQRSLQVAETISEKMGPLPKNDIAEKVLSEIIGNLLVYADKQQILMRVAITDVIDVPNLPNEPGSITQKQYDQILVKFDELKGYHDIEKEMLKESKDYHTYMQVVAHQTAYRSFNVGDDLEGLTSELEGLTSENTGYTVYSVIEDDKGFRALVLKPKNCELNEDGHLNYPPILVFQGTDPSNPWDLHEDFDQKLGAKGIDRNDKDITSALLDCRKEIVEENKGDPNKIRFDLSGHSLGGNRAQRYTAKHPELVSALYTYQSPALDRETVDSFNERVKFLKEAKENPVPGRDYPCVIHVVNSKDLVTDTGEEHLPSDFVVTIKGVRESKGVGGVHTEVSLLKRDDYKISVSKELRVPNKKIESLRKSIGSFVKWFIKNFMAMDKSQAIQEKTNELDEWLREQSTVKRSRPKPPKDLGLMNPFPNENNLL
jgi:hypothetical protein